MKNNLILTASFLVLVSLVGCEEQFPEEEPNVKEYTAPVVSTVSVTDITHKSANVVCNITDTGDTLISEQGVICWSDENDTVKYEFNSYNGPGEYIVSVNELQYTKDYTVKAYASNSAGTSFGNELMFTTLGEPCFNVGAGFNGAVFAMVVQPDNKIVVGGEFTSYNGNECGGIARLNSDGTFDASFNVQRGFYGGSGSDGRVYTLALQPNGGILVSGDFISYRGDLCHNMARLNSDGTMDGGFKASPGVNGMIKSFIVLPDGKIMVGGGFSGINGATLSDKNRPGIARLNTDGSCDYGFPKFADNYRTDFLVESDGKILCESPEEFTDGIARIDADGVVDEDFVTEEIIYIDEVVVQPDGKIIIHNGWSGSHISRLNSNGTIDETFQVSSYSDHIYSLAIQPDNKVMVGGENAIARLNEDGSPDNTFSQSVAGPYSEYYAIIPLSDGKILIGGSLRGIDGPSRYIYKLNSDGSACE